MSDIAPVIASVIIETRRLQRCHRDDLIAWAMAFWPDATRDQAERAFLIAAEIYAADHFAPVT